MQLLKTSKSKRVRLDLDLNRDQQAPVCQWLVSALRLGGRARSRDGQGKPKLQADSNSGLLCSSTRPSPSPTPAARPPAASPKRTRPPPRTRPHSLPPYINPLCHLASIKLSGTTTVAHLVHNRASMSRSIGAHSPDRTRKSEPFFLVSRYKEKKSTRNASARRVRCSCLWRTRPAWGVEPLVIDIHPKL